MTKNNRIQVQKSAVSHLLPSPVKYGGTRFCPSISRQRPSIFKSSLRLNESLPHKASLPIYVSYSGRQIIGSHFSISRVFSATFVIQSRGSESNLVWSLHFLPWQHSGRALRLVLVRRVVSVPYDSETKRKPRWTQVSTQVGLMRPLLRLLGYVVKYPITPFYFLTYRSFSLCLKFVRTLGIRRRGLHLQWLC